ncbi:hypothetical protein AMS68_000726 [Peltaster fructicola]|uniref:Uncharacterized protein n=1 Tax=Peltaster fructicola TaxID=286661 RepID=A0A6H0XKQ0_9PEZI|nr:hypothetical protein AMS68_000726 [Peltaster fructicola]
MEGWAVFLLIVAVFLVIFAVGIFLGTQYRAGRLNRVLGRPNNLGSYRPPAPAPSGVHGWLTDTWSKLRNRRTAGGAYEGTSYGGARGRDRRGFGPLDPDGAWDARVDHEADLAGDYYEEQELGDPGHGPYGGGGYGEVGIAGIPDARGRSRSRQRELDSRYDEEMHGGRSTGTSNPFGDNNELRTANPRPVVDTASGKGHKKNQSSLALSHHSTDDSPTERKSMFRENV